MGAAAATIDDDVSVDDITVAVDGSSGNFKSNTFFGYHFTAKVTIKGRMSKNFLLNRKSNPRQRPRCLTAGKLQRRTLAPTMPQMSNSVSNPENAQNNGWGLDKFNGQYVEWHGMNIDPNSKGGIGSYYDLHQNLEGALLVPGTQDNRKYSYLIDLMRQLRISLLDTTKNEVLGKKVTWGFKWSNWNTIWRPTDAPAPPADVTWGAATNFMGLGKGVFKDINGITGLEFPTPP